MMLPARTDCPPNFFTPRRLLSLSRPLRDEPPAFLCAMTKLGPDYLALGAFLVPALAGAAFSVEAAAGFSSLPVLFLPPALFAGLSAPAAPGLFGAGFSVGVPATSSEACWVASAFDLSFAADFEAAAFGASSPLGVASAFGAAFFDSF